MASLESMPWVGDWAWGVPLIVANLVMHVLGLSLIGAFVLGDYASILRNRKASVDFMMVVGVTRRTVKRDRAPLTKVGLKTAGLPGNTKSNMSTHITKIRPELIG
jgi:hypothetical protein